MSVTIQLDLPEGVLQEASVMGLLDSAHMAELISTEVRRRKAAADLDRVLDDIRAQPGEPMSMEEIQAKVDAVRAKRRSRGA
jgi:hypothetical protein